jgi:hypothetical protein
MHGGSMGMHKPAGEMHSKPKDMSSMVHKFDGGSMGATPKKMVHSKPNTHVPGMAVDHPVSVPDTAHKAPVNFGMHKTAPAKGAVKNTSTKTGGLTMTKQQIEQHPTTPAHTTPNKKKIALKHPTSYLKG